jgi:hypothetical protein
VLTTVEAALSGAVLLQGADGTLRDMVSMHGNYRKVSETQPALGLIGQTLMERRPFQVRWLLDRPVSNSGRLRQIIEQVASERNWPWTVDLVPDPDPVLAESPAIVATADSAILDRCDLWLNLARRVVDSTSPTPTSSAWHRPRTPRGTGWIESPADRRGASCGESRRLGGKRSDGETFVSFHVVWWRERRANPVPDRVRSARVPAPPATGRAAGREGARCWTPRGRRGTPASDSSPGRGGGRDRTCAPTRVVPPCPRRG